MQEGHVGECHPSAARRGWDCGRMVTGSGEIGRSPRMSSTVSWMPR
jgi:hypothetical protein